MQVTKLDSYEHIEEKEKLEYEIENGLSIVTDIEGLLKRQSVCFLVKLLDNDSSIDMFLVQDKYYDSYNTTIRGGYQMVGRQVDSRLLKDKSEEEEDKIVKKEASKFCEQIFDGKITTKDIKLKSVDKKVNYVEALMNSDLFNINTSLKVFLYECKSDFNIKLGNNNTFSQTIEEVEYDFKWYKHNEVYGTVGSTLENLNSDLVKKFTKVESEEKEKDKDKDKQATKDAKDNTGVAYNFKHDYIEKDREIEAYGLVGAESQLERQIFPDVFNYDREFTVDDAPTPSFYSKLKTFVEEKYGDPKRKPSWVDYYHFQETSHNVGCCSAICYDVDKYEGVSTGIELYFKMLMAYSWAFLTIALISCAQIAVMMFLYQPEAGNKWQTNSLGQAGLSSWADYTYFGNYPIKPPKDPENYDFYAKAKWHLLYILLDLLNCLILIIATNSVFKSLSDKAYENYQKVIQPSKYTVQVEFDHSVFEESEYKDIDSIIYDHISKNITPKYEEMNSMGETVTQANTLEVKRVYTARDFNGQIQQLQQFKDTVEEIKLEKTTLLKDGEYIFNDKVLKLLSQLKYYENLVMNSNVDGKTHDDLTPLWTYVTFNRAEHAEQFMKYSERKNYLCCGCCYLDPWAENELLKSKDGHTTRMVVKKVEYEPSDIIWENLDLKEGEKCCRRSLGGVVLLVLIIVSILIVLFAKYAEFKYKERQNYVQRVCEYSGTINYTFQSEYGNTVGAVDFKFLSDFSTSYPNLTDKLQYFNDNANTIDTNFITYMTNFNNSNSNKKLLDCTNYTFYAQNISYCENNNDFKTLYNNQDAIKFYNNFLCTCENLLYTSDNLNEQSGLWNNNNYSAFLINGQQKNMCFDWTKDFITLYTIEQSFKEAFNSMPTVINVVVGIGVSALSDFMRYQTKTEIVVTDFYKLFITSFIIYTILPIAISLDFYVIFIFLCELVGLSGMAAEWRAMQMSASIIENVNTDWYKEVGSAIFISQVYNMVVPQVELLANIFIDYMSNLGKCCKSVFYTADDARLHFRGPKFDFANRMGYLLQVVWSCFILSSAMPLMNLIIYFVFILVLIFDKWYLNYMCQKPTSYNGELVLNLKVYFNIVIILHCIFSIYNFSTDYIIYWGDVENTYDATNTQETFSYWLNWYVFYIISFQFGTKSVLFVSMPYMALIVFMLLLELLSSTLFVFIEGCVKSCQECCFPPEKKKPFEYFDEDLELKMQEKIPITNYSIYANPEYAKVITKIDSAGLRQYANYFSYFRQLKVMWDHESTYTFDQDSKFYKGQLALASHMKEEAEVYRNYMEERTRMFQDRENEAEGMRKTQRGFNNNSNHNSNRV